MKPTPPDAASLPPGPTRPASTGPDPSAAPPTSPADLHAAALRGALSAAGYVPHRVAQALGHIAWNGRALDAQWWNAETYGPLKVLVDCFACGRRVDPAALVKALGAVGYEAAVALGLVTDGAPAFLLLPIGPDLVLMDLPSRTGAPDGLFLGDSSTHAARRGMGTVRVARHLDLGCGSGAMVIAAARTADEVVAVDINPRAIAVLDLAATVAGARNVRGLVADAVGDLQADHGIGTFDRVSFVLPLLSRRLDMAAAPVHTIGATVDLLEAFLGRLPSLLAPGGTAIVYTQVHLPGGTLPEVLGRAMGARSWRAHFFQDWEAQTEVGLVPGGLLVLRADVTPGDTAGGDAAAGDTVGNYSAGDAPPDRPGEESWAKAIAAVLGRW